MDKLTVLKVIDIINKHIVEVRNMPGKPVGRDQVIEELNLLTKELLQEIKTKN